MTLLARRSCLLLALLTIFGFSAFSPRFVSAQERRAKLRISNAGFTITALPLLAAKDWRIFESNNLDMEVILMQSALVPAAVPALNREE